MAHRRGGAPGDGSGAAEAADTEAIDAKERLKHLVSRMTDDQLARYEAFRRSHFERSLIKSYLAPMVPEGALTEDVLIALTGTAKVFVGNLVETAREVMEESAATGPIQPFYIREAFRRLVNAGQIPYLPGGPKRRRLR